MLSLTSKGLEALREFADPRCWGNFSDSSMLKSWERACTAAKVHPIPRPYDLRHSFATEPHATTGDPKASATLRCTPRRVR